MLNRITIMGRLTADPELRHTQSGVAVTTFFLACDRDFRDKATGEKETDFFPVVCWRQTAEFAARYFAKGRLVVVSGRLQLRDYTDKEGNRKSATEIQADQVYFGESRRPDDAPKAEKQPARPDPFADLQEADDDDIPF